MIGKEKFVLCFRYMRLPVKNSRRPKIPLGLSLCCSKGANEEKKVKKDKGSKKSSKSSKATTSGEGVDSNGANDPNAKPILTKHSEKSVCSSLIKKRCGDRKSIGLENGEKVTKKKGGDRKSIGLENGEKVLVEPGGKAGQPRICNVLGVRKGVDGAQVVAGWPSWLTSVAGEAINGWVPRTTDTFEKLDKIGQGTYSSVYRALDLEAGTIVALKKVRFANMDPESVRFMAREILVLRRLDHPNVMKLEGLVISKVSSDLYLVFEYMEHDLSGLASFVKFTEPQIKCFMQQLLRGLQHCHNRGVLHRDIKASNLLIDNNGNLKIGDFGLATFFHGDNQKQPLTSRVVTLWYRPPELLLGATDYGVAVDLWSSGCILAELFMGKPIMSGRTEVEQLHRIYKLCGSPSEEYWKKSKLANATVFKPQQPYKRRVAETFKDFPSSALSLLETLLAFEPECRGTTTSALQSEFFTTKPLPCDPSSLPKYPACKEFNARMRNEEARRQRAAAAAAAGKGTEVNQHARNGSTDSKPVPTQHANAQLSSSQRHKGQPNSKINSEFYNPDNESVSGYPRGNSLGCHSWLRCASGNSLHVDDRLHLDPRRGLDSSVFGELKSERSFIPQGAATAAASAQLSRNTSIHSCWLERCPRARYEPVQGVDSSNYGLLMRKENCKGYTPRKSSIHYSGPMWPTGGNVEEMLKEHEKHIQIAVRKALASRKSHTDK